MNIERATYNRRKVNECIERIRHLNKTVKTRGEHGDRIFELQKVYDFCYENTGCCLFNLAWDCTPWNDYIKAYDQRMGKKKLDELLRRSVLYLQNEITEIVKCMELGEVNTDYS